MPICCGVVGNISAGDESKGLYFICCELIEDNGSKLREYVIEHARKADLGDDFISWIESANVFADTLVDRIVSGAPDSAEYVVNETGYDDKCAVKASYIIFGLSEAKV